MKKIHKLLEINAEKKQAICSECGPIKIVTSGYNSAGNRKWKCSARVKYQKYKTYRPWTLHKGLKCEKCGFIPEHESQLDVDHIDGNKSNNEVLNLQTLCANCHRLKTYLNKDWHKIKL